MIIKVHFTFLFYILLTYSVSAQQATNNDIGESIDATSISFDVYPNPVAEELFINISSKVTPKELQIFDVKGKLVLIQKADSLMDINVSRFTSGFYFLRLNTQEGTIVKKFFKN